MPTVPPKSKPEPRRLDASECRDCKAPIYWIKMAKSGSNMPLERGADRRVVVDPETGEGTLQAVYKPHWSSCPFAQNFKKEGK